MKYVIAYVILVICLTGLPLSVYGVSYLALGDSFTSGEGETSDANYLFQDGSPSQSCHLSNRSYPYVAAVLTKIDTVHSVACSGAEIKDIYGITSYYGQHDRLLTEGSMPSPDDLSFIKNHALSTYSPGQIYQSSFVQKYQPDMLSVGIGGNDIGMIDKLKDCMGLDTCHWAVSDGRIQAGREIKRLYPKLVALYRFLLSESPHSRLYVVGYPKIINPSGNCDVLIGTLFNSVERQFMDESIAYLDTIIGHAALSVGAVFVAEDSVFTGNALCDTTSTPAMNTIRFGDDIAPIGAISQLKLIGAESFHPTPYGHSLLARNLAFCISVFNDLPITVPEALAPDEPDYWGDDGRELSESVHADMAKPVIASRSFTLTLPRDSFVPQSSVQVLVHSSERLLTTATVGVDGALTTTVSLPSGLMDGPHSLIVRGEDTQGQPVEYYQSIEYDPPGNSAAAPLIVSTKDTPAITHHRDQRTEVGSEVLGVSKEVTGQLNTGSLHLQPKKSSPWKTLLNACALVVFVFVLGVVIIVLWRGT